MFCWKHYKNCVFSRTQLSKNTVSRNHFSRIPRIPTNSVRTFWGTNIFKCSLFDDNTGKHNLSGQFFVVFIFVFLVLFRLFPTERKNKNEIFIRKPLFDIPTIFGKHYLRIWTLFVILWTYAKALYKRGNRENLGPFLTQLLGQFLTQKPPSLWPGFNSTACMHAYMHIFTYIYIYTYMYCEVIIWAKFGLSAVIIWAK